MHYQLIIIYLQKWLAIKSSNWYLNEISSFEGSQIKFQASQFAISQVTKETTHILDSELLRKSIIHITT